jgi:putative transposase
MRTLVMTTPLSMRRACATLQLSRASCYRGEVPLDPELALRDEMQHLALEMPSYGYRRMTEELHRRGWWVNHKHVLRLLRQDNLLCLRKRRFVTTTDAAHGLPIYPNLAAHLTLTGLNQLWVADITYIRLQREFVYLAVLLDAYSRRCIGWQIDRRLHGELALVALQMALASRDVPAGLVHHSDRGVQYACGDYTDLLQSHRIEISMSRSGNPYDNARAESFIKTLKYEEVHLSEYQDLAEVEHSIGHFLEIVYNRKRLHSSLGYLPPAEFEEQYRRQQEASSLN